MVVPVNKGLGHTDWVPKLLCSTLRRNHLLNPLWTIICSRNIKLSLKKNVIYGFGGRAFPSEPVFILFLMYSFIYFNIFCTSE